MRRLLEFKAFETINGLTEVQKVWLDKCTSGSWSVGGGGKVDVQGNFHSYWRNLENFKGVRFGRVSGDFFCRNNRLETLEGAPESVGGDFYCSNNNLTTLEGSPESVGGDFYCGGSKLITLEGAPETVGGGFYCNNNNLTTLEGAPESIGGSFYCHRNRLTTLEGAPEGVGRDFLCQGNNLTSLEGAPETVGGNFFCHDNSLTTLEGAPETIGGEFSSDSIDIPEGQWGISGWLKVLEEGTPKDKKLIATLITPEALNKRLEESPEKTMVALKSVWNSSEFVKTRSQLMIPKGYEDEMDLMGDLDDIGL
jgi:hypothetical protein